MINVGAARECKECKEIFDFQGGSLFCSEVCRVISLKISGYKSRARKKAAEEEYNYEMERGWDVD